MKKIGFVMFCPMIAMCFGLGGAIPTLAFAAMPSQSSVRGAAPTLAFVAIPDQAYGEKPFSITATSNSTGAITYSVVSGPASISGNTITLTGVGTITLQASQAAAGGYNATTVTTVFRTNYEACLSNSSTTDSFQGFGGTEDEEYKLGAGDQISVTVVGHAEATGKQIVGPDGIITVLYVGDIKVSDLTRTEAATKIRENLAKFYKDIPTDSSVMVGVDAYNSNHLTVLGAVAHPGLMQLDGPATLLSVITRAGMLSEPSAVIQGKPTGVPERVAVFRGSSIAWIDFRRILECNKPELMTHLRKNDVVYVPSPHQRYVSVFGEVLHQGLLDLQNGSTLVQLLAESGGIVTDRAGRFPKIQIIHEFTKSVETVNYADILQSNKLSYRLEDGDIIYVPQSKFERVSVTFQKISPLISIATIAGLIQR